MSITITADLMDPPPSLSDEGGVPMTAARHFYAAVDNTDTQDLTKNMFQLQRVLNHTSIPKNGDTLGASGPIFLENTFCISRVATAIAIDKVHVVCNYRYYDTSLNQAKNVISNTGLKVSTTDVDPNGSDITVRHQEITQVAEVSVFLPDESFAIEVILDTNMPERVSRDWLLHTNASKWKGYDPGTVLCTNASFKLLKIALSTKKYIFRFEFRIDPRGWAPIASWRSLETGRSPANLLTTTSGKENVGKRKIENFYTAKDFTVDPPA